MLSRWSDYKFRFKTIAVKLSHWEYWNSSFIYGPVMPILLWKMIRAGSPFVFNATNPGIEYGGFTMESKWKIQQGSIASLFPKTLYIEKDNSPEEYSEELLHSGFPLIAKPDIGGKGRGVAVLNSVEDFYSYHKNCPINFLVQEKINYPKEAGIFYVKNPDDSTGKITGIVEKEFVFVTGDGSSTVMELIEKNNRFLLQREALSKIICVEVLKGVPNKDENISLLEIGNHARGSRFIDASFRINSQLEEVIENIAKEIPGFYFGRFDIKFNSWEELFEGKNFAIIELNGSGSEPTHIYDSSYSILTAWKIIIRHWAYLFEISKSNRAKGHRYMTFFEGLKLLFSHYVTMKALEQFNPSAE